MDAITLACDESIKLSCEILAFECRDHKARLEHPLSDAAKEYLANRNKLIKSSMGKDGALNQPEPWTITDDYRSQVIFKTENQLAQERYDSLKMVYIVR